jgi:hypothetical protein
MRTRIAAVPSNKYLIVISDNYYIAMLAFVVTLDNVHPLVHPLGRTLVDASPLRAPGLLSLLETCRSVPPSTFSAGPAFYFHADTNPFSSNPIGLTFLQIAGCLGPPKAQFPHPLSSATCAGKAPGFAASVYTFARFVLDSRTRSRAARHRPKSHLQSNAPT